MEFRYIVFFFLSFFTLFVLGKFFVFSWQVQLLAVKFGYVIASENFSMLLCLMIFVEVDL